LSTTSTTDPTLRQRAVRGAAWTLPTSVGSRAIGLLGTLMLARYLVPDQYGVAMAASIAATTASSITTFGVGIYFVANVEIPRADTFHATCWFLVSGAAVLLATMVLGHSLARWSGAPGLERYLPAFVVAMWLERIIYIPERILVRNLRFRWLSLARAAGELTFTAVAVAAAARGAGAMAIAWGSLARSGFRFVALVPAVDWRDWLEPHRLRLEIFCRLIGYGVTVTSASIATFGMRRWDNLLISRFYGAALMGAYNYAYNLADTPATAVGDQMSDVIGASFPHVSQQRRGDALVDACTMVSLIMFPLSVGLATVAPTIVDTFFDPKWASIEPMLMWLAALSMARPIANILAAYLYASNRPGIVLWIEWATLGGVVAAISTVGRLGITWACAWVGIVFVLRTLAGMWTVSRLDGVRLSAFLLPMTRPLFASFVMAAGILAARSTFAGLAAPIRLVEEIALGGILYGCGVLILAKSDCTEIVRVARAALTTTP
jgi:PST family polysaccharide transporter